MVEDGTMGIAGANAAETADAQDASARVLSLINGDGAGPANYDNVVKSASVEDVRAYISSGTDDKNTLVLEIFDASGDAAGKRFRGLLAEILCKSVIAWASGDQNHWCEWYADEVPEDKLFGYNFRRVSEDRRRFEALATVGEWSALLTTARFAPTDRVGVINRIVHEPLPLPRTCVEALLAHIVRVGGPLNVSEALCVWSALGKDDAERLKHLEKLDDGYSFLTRAILENAPAELWQALERRWDIADEWTRRWTNLSGLRRHAAARVFAPARLVIGYECGLWIDESRCEPTRESVSRALNGLGFVQMDDDSLDAFVPQAKLWACLRKLARYEAESYKRRTELTALRPDIADLATEAPVTWAESLRWILARAGSLAGCAEAVTFSQVLNGGPVRNALSRACMDPKEIVRDRARGIEAALRGLEAPTAATSRQLLSFAARLLDGTPIFPQPLAVRSRTWIADPGLENATDDAFRRAASWFAQDVEAWGAADEETLTGVLLTHLAAEFRGQQYTLTALVGSFAPAQHGRITLEHKPASKHVDEPEWGCDVAVLTRAEVPRQLRLASVTLVQVKKSLAIAAEEAMAHRAIMSSGPFTRPDFAQRADSWVIKIRQLRDVIKRCQTAVYWLVAASGQVLVVPARYLNGLLDGSDRGKQGTFTIGYHQIRSLAIPLEQFLVDLVIGVWIGSSEDEVLAFGRGDSGRTRPRHVLDIEVNYGNS
ncbi:hypothetical protein [Sorangium sp. So ce887]|uniref:hypothetical protein n=1 Tax=Sorangium sp. So ce887 TaxID=3133324 RepID=UPI003F6471D4